MVVSVIICIKISNATNCYDPIKLTNLYVEPLFSAVCKMNQTLTISILTSMRNFVLIQSTILL